MLATSSIPHHFNPSHGIMCTTIFPAMQYLVRVKGKYILFI
ncbi:hypothetical protein T01_13448 [Trichinella spiralis]|uniref:Uncharacterized protein n=1 Tax=Trichinella spiralis TaxID=6334 RepID=A0A0V0YX64_TRISP|nr:hypothetical protein T01_13448 [Trichinella spiralis]